IQVGPVTVTFTNANCVNQNWCSLIISASSTIEPPADGAVTVTFTVTLALGATSPGRAKAWLVSQLAWLPDPPEDLAKCRARSTSVYPGEGHVVVPVFVTVTGKVWVWPEIHVVGALLRL